MPYDNTKIQFAPNVPQVITLDTDPVKAKKYEKTFKNEDGSDYVSCSWLYFGKGKLMFYATERLHDFLLGFNRGDTLTITKVQAPGQRTVTWNVEGGVRNAPDSSTNDYAGNLKEIFNAIERLNNLIVKILSDENPSIILDPADEPRENRESEFDKDLGF